MFLLYLFLNVKIREILAKNSKRFLLSHGLSSKTSGVQQKTPSIQKENVQYATKNNSTQQITLIVGYISSECCCFQNIESSSSFYAILSLCRNIRFILGMFFFLG